jgi:hypothetical protein
MPWRPNSHQTSSISRGIFGELRSPIRLRDPLDTACFRLLQGGSSAQARNRPRSLVGSRPSRGLSSSPQLAYYQERWSEAWGDVLVMIGGSRSLCFLDSGWSLAALCSREYPTFHKPAFQRHGGEVTRKNPKLHPQLPLIVLRQAPLTFMDRVEGTALKAASKCGPCRRPTPISPFRLQEEGPKGVNISSKNSGRQKKHSPRCGEGPSPGPCLVVGETMGRTFPPWSQPAAQAQPSGLGRIGSSQPPSRRAPPL